MIALLVASDLRTLTALRDFESNAAEVVELVDVRSTIQDDRHLGSDPAADTAVIDALSAEIADRLNESPAGSIDRRSDALRALLTAEEALLREDLELRSRAPDALSVARLHTIQTDALSRFVAGASVEGVSELEAATVDRSWRTATLLRARYLDDPSEGVSEAWGSANAVRVGLIDQLVGDETRRLELDTAALADAELRRLTGLATIVGLVLLAGVVGSFLIRRSIVQPLRVLARAATRLSKGELAPIDDRASDEIASVARAFSSLSDTMHSLWTDVDEIAASVRHTEFDRRIGTDEFEGDWLRLAQTMNTTLETGAEYTNAVEAELVRRDVLTDISGAAVLAGTASELTEMVLESLPAAHHGAAARLHQHPSGPPIFDVGVELAPAISALSVPTRTNHAAAIEHEGGTAVASLVDFGVGPPAVLVLTLGASPPADLAPLVSLVDTAAQVLAQGHRRQAAEWSAAHNFEHDALTGLPNDNGLRRWFDDGGAGDGEWAIVGVQPRRLEILDGTWGRGARDAALSIVARRLRRMARPIDVVARGDDPEFVLAVRAEDVDLIVDRVVAAFRHPLSIGDELVAVDLTLGVAPLGAALPDAIADAATAIRQSEGRETEVIHFEQRHRDAAVRRAEVERWLEIAIDENELTVHFQPIVDANTTEPVGYECLVRGSMHGTPVSPGEFIPIAEETGLISSIGAFTLRESCAALPFLPGDQPYVSVNLSPIELADTAVTRRLRSILDESGVARDRVVLEVTEGATTDAEAVDRLHEIRALGVRIAIDDFGTGQSNLSYLTSLPAQILKLDRALITPMVDDEASRMVVQAAVSLAHEIGMTVVGEGVETDEELAELRAVECDRVQGWLTGRPAPLADLVDVEEGRATKSGRVRDRSVS